MVARVTVGKKKVSVVSPVVKVNVLAVGGDGSPSPPPLMKTYMLNDTGHEEPCDTLTP
jgi:hypothetical protein